ncbi:GDP-L-galactose phosphorylase [Salix suchowensis]|nr:GDP-L-galactose phosphorylase [Salix suchowensis]
MLMFFFPVSKLPLYAFKEDNSNLIGNIVEKSSEEQPQICFLHNLLPGQWEDRMSRGLFRHDVTACDTKIIPGRYGFIAQLNKGRHLKKRPTEFRVDKDRKKCFSGLKKAMTQEAFSPPVTADSNSSSVVAMNVSPIEYGHVLLIPQVLNCLPQKIDHGCRSSRSFL